MAALATYVSVDAAPKVTYVTERVLRLDKAEFGLDSGAWEQREELLRVGNALRARLGIPPRQGGMAQLWVEPQSVGDQPRLGALR